MKIQDYLILAGQTQAEFAKNIGVSQGLVSLYIQKKKSPSKRTAQKIHAKTKGAVTFSDLFAE